MVFKRIHGSNRGVTYGDGGVLEVRASGRNAEKNGKGGAGRSGFDSINLLEVMAMVMTAYAKISMKERDRVEEGKQF